GQINLLIALNGAQAADLSATEIYLHVDTGFLAVPELEATGIQGDGATLGPVLPWPGDLAVALVSQALQVGDQLIVVHRRALVKLDRAGIDACGQCPLQRVKIAAHGVVYPGTPAGNNQYGQQQDAPQAEQ